MSGSFPPPEASREGDGRLRPRRRRSTWNVGGHAAKGVRRARRWVGRRRRRWFHVERLLERRRVHGGNRAGDGIDRSCSVRSDASVARLGSPTWPSGLGRTAVSGPTWSVSMEPHDHRRRTRCATWCSDYRRARVHDCDDSAGTDGTRTHSDPTCKTAWCARRTQRRDGGVPTDAREDGPGRGRAWPRRLALPAAHAGGWRACQDHALVDGGAAPRATEDDLSCGSPVSMCGHGTPEPGRARRRTAALTMHGPGPGHRAARSPRRPRQGRAGGPGLTGRLRASSRPGCVPRGTTAVSNSQGAGRRRHDTDAHDGMTTLRTCL